jgi:hypothetical protein
LSTLAFSNSVLLTVTPQVTASRIPSAPSGTTYWVFCGSSPRVAQTTQVRTRQAGKLKEGGAPGHARGRACAQLIFQDLFKKEQQSANGRRSKSGETPDGAADLRVA